MKFVVHPAVFILSNNCFLSTSCSKKEKFSSIKSVISSNEIVFNGPIAFLRFSNKIFNRNVKMNAQRISLFSAFTLKKVLMIYSILNFLKLYFFLTITKKGLSLNIWNSLTKYKGFPVSNLIISSGGFVQNLRLWYFLKRSFSFFDTSSGLKIFLDFKNSSINKEILWKLKLLNSMYFMHLKARKIFNTEMQDKMQKIDWKELNGIRKESPKPTRFPRRIDTLVCRASLFVKSTILLFLAKFSMIDVREIKFPLSDINFTIFAVVAIIKKCFVNINEVDSIKKLRELNEIDATLHNLGFFSIIWLYFVVNIIEPYFKFILPIWPTPSFMAQFIPAENTNPADLLIFKFKAFIKTWVVIKFIALNETFEAKVNIENPE